MLGPSAALPAAEPMGLIKGCGKSRGHNYHRPTGRNILWTGGKHSIYII